VGEDVGLEPGEERALLLDLFGCVPEVPDQHAGADQAGHPPEQDDDEQDGEGPVPP
jgi:hypothetical protein